MNYIDLLKFEYILWVDFGSEGWKPTGLTDLNVLPTALRQTYGSECILTKQVKLDIREIK